MKKQQLLLHKTDSGNYRSVIKTKHGRLIYLEISEGNNSLSVKNCYYLDRIRCGEYYSSPLKFVTKKFSYTEILDVIASELDRQYFGVEITDKFADITKDEFINFQLKAMRKKYNFLIFVGEGEFINNVPSVIKTRFKNKIHRCIYLELHYRNGKGVIADCHYEDREYKARTNVIPETLSTVFFNYDRDTIIHIVNTELDTDFTDIIFVTDGSINIENKVALCGNI